MPLMTIIEMDWGDSTDSSYGCMGSVRGAAQTRDSSWASIGPVEQTAGMFVLQNLHTITCTYKPAGATGKGCCEGDPEYML